MSAKKLPIKASELGRLAKDLEEAPSKPSGQHLPEEHMVAYSIDPAQLSPEERSRFEFHLASCDECGAAMEHLLDVSEAWQGAAGEARLARLSERILAGSGATSGSGVRGGAGAIRNAFDELWALVDQANDGHFHAGLTAAAGAPLTVDARRGHVTMHDVAGSALRVGVSFLDAGLAGTRILVEPFGETLVLGPVAPDEVAGEIIIARSARTGLPTGSVVRLRPAPEEP
jgi:hypothetical protein